MRIVDYLADKYNLELDRNGYGESIMSEREDCFICHSPDVTRHELVFGTANRKKSKAMGLWVWICPRCHNVCHRDKNTIETYQKLAQQQCDAWYGEGTFFEVFGRNFL